MQQPPNPNPYNPQQQFQQPSQYPQFHVPGQFQYPPPPQYTVPPKRPSGFRHWLRTRSRNTKIGLGCGTLIAALLLCICATSVYGSSTVATTLTPTPISTPTTDHATLFNPPTVNEATDTPMPTFSPLPTLVPTPIPTQVPTTITKAPVHPDSSIQDAAQGWAHGIAKSGVNNGIVWVTDDGVSDANSIKLDCFNIQQAIWYGLKSTINADGSTTIIKSDFLEVDITFLNNGASVACCHLTSQTVDKIDNAGLWNDGDYEGAWTMYDSASMQ